MDETTLADKLLIILVTNLLALIALRESKNAEILLIVPSLNNASKKKKRGKGNDSPAENLYKMILKCQIYSQC